MVLSASGTARGPGVDRCGDVFRHGNAAGSAKRGGVLCLAGDDHGAKSSTVPHRSDHAFISALMPLSLSLEHP